MSFRPPQNSLSEGETKYSQWVGAIPVQIPGDRLQALDCGERIRMGRIELDAEGVDGNAIFFAFVAVENDPGEFVDPSLKRHEKIELCSKLARDRCPDADTERSDVKGSPVMLKRDFPSNPYTCNGHFFARQTPPVRR